MTTARANAGTARLREDILAGLRASDDSTVGDMTAEQLLDAYAAALLIAAADEVTDSHTAYVVMCGNLPVATATQLPDAKACALAHETEYSNSGETRWDEHSTDAYRLMRREPGRRRFSWTQYWVKAVPNVSGETR